MTLTDSLTWGAFWIAVAVVAGALLPALEYFKPRKAECLSIVTTGSVARYGNPTSIRPTDKELFDCYMGKVLPSNRPCFLIQDVPLYFVIPPSSDSRPIHLRVSDTRDRLNESKMVTCAANLGLDWCAFCEWRRQEQRGKFKDSLDKTGIRIASIDVYEASHSLQYTLGITRAEFLDYQRREGALTLSSPLLPDMRLLLEGEAWDKQEVDLSLIYKRNRIEGSQAQGSSETDLSWVDRYSMVSCVAVLVTTSDNYLVLQRRSKHVSHGGGNLNVSASGFLDWQYDVLGIPKWMPQRLQIPSWFDALGATRKKHSAEMVVVRAALRRLFEETGISKRDVKDKADLSSCCLGAAFNLLHGRDLNFYFHFRLDLKAEQVARLRPIARNRWEVASLVFIPITKITANGELDKPFKDMLRLCNRHLRGALYCLAKSGRIAEIQHVKAHSSELCAEDADPVRHPS